MPSKNDDVTPHFPFLSLWFLHYSYAIIMWEVLSRQIPFEGNSFFNFFYYCLILFELDLSWCYHTNCWSVCVCVFACSEVTNPMQIMFSVLRGMRPDTSLDSLPADIPSRETLITLMTCGWTSNPDERPSFLSKFTQKTGILFWLVRPFSQFGMTSLCMLSNRQILLVTAEFLPWWSGD